MPDTRPLTRTVPDTRSVIDDAARASFRRSGYVVLNDALTAAELDALRTSLDEILESGRTGREHSEHDIDRGTDRQFLSRQHESVPALEEFVLTGTPAKIARDLVPEDPRLFVEQFVVKGPTSGASFAWHQDSGYVGFEHEPYLTLWVALDDATVDNGCLSVLPRDLDAEPMVEPHVWDPQGKERVGYRGDEAGEVVECPAGTVVAFSSLTLHRSGPNTTEHPRRAYVCQYTTGPLIDPATGEPKHFARTLGI